MRQFPSKLVHARRLWNLNSMPKRLKAEQRQSRWTYSFHFKCHEKTHSGLHNATVSDTKNSMCVKFSEWKQNLFSYLQSRVISKQGIAVHNLGSHVWIRSKCLKHRLCVWGREHILHQLWVFHHLLHEALHPRRVEEPRRARTSASGSCPAGFSAGSRPRIWKRVAVFLPLLRICTIWKKFTYILTEFWKLQVQLWFFF